MLTFLVMEYNLNRYIVLKLFLSFHILAINS